MNGQQNPLGGNRPRGAPTPIRYSSGLRVISPAEFQRLSQGGRLVSLPQVRTASKFVRPNVEVVTHHPVPMQNVRFVSSGGGVGSPQPQRLLLQTGLTGGSPLQLSGPITISNGKIVQSGSGTSSSGPTRLIVGASTASQLLTHQNQQKQTIKTASGLVTIQRKIATAPAPTEDNSPGRSGAPIDLEPDLPDAVTPPAPKRRVMRLKGRFRPLHDKYFVQNGISEQDADVVFVCSDGGRVRAHKLILASCSKFFTDVLIDQTPGEISTIVVPDVPSDAMKLLVTMTYKDNVVVTASQLERLKEYSKIFGMDFDRLSQEPDNNKREIDVKPGKFMENIIRARTASPLRQLTPQRPPPPYGAAIRTSVGGPIMMAGLTSPFKMPPGITVDQFKKLPTAKRSGSIMSNQNRMNIKANTVEDTKVMDMDKESEEDFTFQLQGYASEHTERRKAKQTPRVETETDEPDPTEFNGNPADSENLINAWIQQVGKNEQPEPKRPKLSQEDDEDDGNYKCTICNLGFEKEYAWKWHQDRHVDVSTFKCTLCDSYRPTSRAIWYHEKNKHDLDTPGINDVIPMPPPQAQRQQVSPTRLLQLQKLQAARMAAVNKAKHQQQLPRKSTNDIQIGHSPGIENVDAKKLKYLHWMYVCGRCDNFADNRDKAFTHFQKCYPEKEIAFENTVTKYRQGFYGKSKCPQCPKQYAANGGFVLHCARNHPDYRRLFQHTGTTEDKLKCISCHRIFGLPDEFHSHLDNGQECNLERIDDESLPFLSPQQAARKDGGKGKFTPTKAGKPAVPATPPQPPRSARLAKRASLTSLAVTRALENAKEVEQDERERRQAKRRSSTSTNIDYPPADCPICGQAEVPNISQHLSIDHKELNISANRISTELLRCKKCLITFAICDLLGHMESCSTEEDDATSIPNKDKQDDQLNQNEVEPEPPAVPEYEIPPGVGDSPIDIIGVDDLMDINVVAKALVCGVCNTKGTKLGDAALCLKYHGVYRCALCFNSYVDKLCYQQHMKQCHCAVGANKLQCPLCPKSFFNVGQTAGHLIQSHWGDLLAEIRTGKKREISLLNDDDPVFVQGPKPIIPIPKSPNVNTDEDEVLKKKNETELEKEKAEEEDKLSKSRAENEEKLAKSRAAFRALEGEEDSDSTDDDDTIAKTKKTDQYEKQLIEIDELEDEAESGEVSTSKPDEKKGEGVIQMETEEEEEIEQSELDDSVQTIDSELSEDQ